ncbi:hypothetical protein [Tabrizicola sp.]|jgi:hypothetical protein|uniref:hypothetical protein n=1 Tax=Tabrizicola sp. TaxID=2005166 RepID=UPI001A43B5DD|nr:hypothetical protein [Tabrizicola sp.]MBL9062547.1 hypothetical protein [Tabrizicola sp.]
MDQNFETVPFHYLRADRRLFVNSEYLLQLDDVENPDTQPGRHWFVDALVFEPGRNRLFLCEFSFSKSLGGLKKRLEAWAAHWDAVKAAVVRDSALDADVSLRPWAFVPEECIPALLRIAEASGFDGSIPDRPPIKITNLEMTLPWKYRFWKRTDEARKPDSIPATMR